MRKLGPILLAAAVLLTAGCAGGTKQVTIENFPSNPPAVTIQGDVTVPADSVNSQDVKGGICVGTDGYEDIVGGAQIRITSSTGAVIGTGTLGPGHTSELFTDDTIINGKASKCAYHFQIDGISGQIDTYGISVGGPARGTLYYSREQLSEPLQIVVG